MALSDSYVKPNFTPVEEKANREADMQRAFLEESGLEDMDASRLRKTMLSADEAVAAKTEQMEDLRIRKSRKHDWDEYVDARRRWGYARHHSDILARLHRLIPNLYVDDGFVRNTLSLYIWDRNQPFEINDKVNLKIGGTVNIGWMQKGWSPEYEIDLPNDVGVAVRQIRGYRTLLMRLMTRRAAKTFMPRPLFSESAAHAEFGAPTNGRTASNYREVLYTFRNTSPERAKLNHQILEAAQKYQYA